MRTVFHESEQQPVKFFSAFELFLIYKQHKVSISLNLLFLITLLYLQDYQLKSDMSALWKLWRAQHENYNMQGVFMLICDRWRQCFKVTPCLKYSCIIIVLTEEGLLHLMVQSHNLVMFFKLTTLLYIYYSHSQVWWKMTVSNKRTDFLKGVQEYTV